MTAEPRLSFIENFFSNCRNQPDSPAFGISGRVYTYKELMELVQRIRHQLESQMDPSEKRIAVFATQEIHTYASILAILASGRAYMPLNPHNPPERNWSCLEQADCPTMLRGSARTELKSWVVEHRHSLKVIDRRKPRPVPFFDRLPGRTRMISPIFCSLREARVAPKGVPLYHRNLEAFLNALLTDPDFDFQKSDRFLQMFDLTFDLSIMSTFVPLAIGASLYVVNQDNAGFLNILAPAKRTADRSPDGPLCLNFSGKIL